ncbi:MAG: hypothetical protein ACKO24_10780, partial [Leptolyngbyaceae cyanobacterium]
MILHSPMYPCQLRTCFGVSSRLQHWPLVAVLFMLVSAAQVSQVARAQAVEQAPNHSPEKGEATVRDLQVRASEPLANGPAVSSLSDVMPSDWAFQALRNLVETYGCIQGYPD